MKHVLLTLMLSSLTLLHANQANTTNTDINEHIKNAVDRVESAREDAMSSLMSMIHSVDKARTSGTNKGNSTATQIIETHAISDMAKSTANVEAIKANAISLITQAIDKLDPNSIITIADAVASVEVAKAKAAAAITRATGRVEISKTKLDVNISHPKETLTIAKNMSAIAIAKSVAQVEVAKAVSMIEMTKSSINTSLPKLTKKSKEELEDIKATATANISTYLAQIEVMKSNMLSKIAQEVAKVEIAKLQIDGIRENKEENSTTYPKILIKAN